MEEDVATAEEKQQQRDEANDGHTANSHSGSAGDAGQLHPRQLPPAQRGVRLPPAAAHGKMSFVTRAAAADWWLRLIARWEPGTIRSSGAGTPT